MIFAEKEETIRDLFADSAIRPLADVKLEIIGGGGAEVDSAHPSRIVGNQSAVHVVAIEAIVDHKEALVIADVAHRHKLPVLYFLAVAL